ncbi:Zn-ribbon domain-containing OB-fold protein [[Eubacterium] cellulosolvens]
MTVARFWREQKNRYNLMGSKCGNCGRIFFPPKEICRDCHRKSIGKMEGVRLCGSGKIVSYSIIHEGPEAFKDQIPYVMAIIELSEGPRITAQVVDLPSEVTTASSQAPGQDNTDAKETQKLTIGSTVKSVFRKISEDGKSGIIHYGYKFKLCPSND